MARDDGPSYVTIGDAPRDEVAEFAHSRTVTAIAFAVAATLAAGLVGLRLIVEVKPPALWFWYFSTAGLGLFTLVAFGALRAALGPQNWLLRVGRQGLWLKFRSYLNHRLPATDAVVVHIPYRAIAWIAGAGGTLDVPDPDGGTTSVRMRALDIHLNDDAWADELAQRLREERGRWVRGRLGRGRSSHFPVQVLPDRTIRVTWRGPHDFVTPGLARALAVLRRYAPRLPRPRERGHERLEDLPVGDREDRIVELVRRGDRMAAIRAARVLYGQSLTEATAFVDELEGR